MVACNKVFLCSYYLIFDAHLFVLGVALSSSLYLSYKCMAASSLSRERKKVKSLCLTD
jgi:hypothetical protein